MRPWTLSFLLTLLLVGPGCRIELGGDPADDDDDAIGDDDDAVGDDDDSVDPAFVLELSPEPDETGFPVVSPMFVQFDQDPGTVDWTVMGPDGPVTMAVVAEDDGARRVGIPSEDLAADSEHRVMLSWTGQTDALEFTFWTDETGSKVDELAAVVGVTYVSSILDGKFVEPAGAGPLIQAQLDDIPLMLTVREETTFAAEDQPGFHMLGAVGRFEPDGTAAQEDCTATIGMTAGPDGLFGTEDDDPGTLSNPSFEVGPTTLAVTAQGTALDLRDLVLTGTFPPSLAAIEKMTLSAVADTRPLDGLLEGGEEGAICELLSATVEVDCIPCQAPAPPGDFCLVVVIEGLTAPLQPLTELQERTCSDIIDSYLAGIGCAAEAFEFDSDGDGDYDLCPGWGG